MNRSIEANNGIAPRRAVLLSWALYDWANSAFYTVILTFVFAAYFTRAVAPDPIEGSRIWGTVLGLGGLAVALSGPLLGAVADQTGRRKPWIAVFTSVCVGSTALLWLIQPSSTYMWLGVILVAVGAYGVELAIVFYNATLAAIAPPDRVGRWSGWGWSLGYAGGLVSLGVVLLAFVNERSSLFSFDRDSAEHLRASFVFIALWFLFFSIPFFLFVPDGTPTGKSLVSAMRGGIIQLRESVRNIRQYTQILRFIMGAMLYNEGLSTLFAFGGVYAAGTFKMDEEQILLFGIALNVSAGLGALAFSWIDDLIGSKRTILVSLAGLILCAAMILLVEDVALFWIGGVLLGIFVGPVQAASRTYLARVSPPDLKNQFFGLLAFSGKATAFLGPLTVGWLTHFAESQRAGMSMILVLWIAGFILIAGLPATRGARARSNGT